MAAPAEAVLAIAGTRPNSDMATGSCPSRAAAGRGPTVEWLLLAARVRATSVPACCVAPDHRPSPGVGQSRPMASAYGLGFFPQLSGCRIRPQPGRRPESWALATGPGGALLARLLAPGALARPVQLPARGLSALGRALTAGRRAPGVGPDGRSGWATLARRIATGATPPST